MESSFTPIQRMIDFEEFKERYQKVPVEEYPNRVVETMPEPMVSVKVSTYQHVDFIEDCLEGILMQETDFPVEILIGEDESDDGTREICKEYAEQYPEQIRLFLHRRENNIAIHGRPTPKFQATYTRFMCRGKYVAMCEGDDYWRDPKKLQKQVEVLEANPEHVLSHHSAQIVSVSEGCARGEVPKSEVRRGMSGEELMRNPFLSTVTVMFKNVLKGYPEELIDVMNGDRFLFSILGQYGGAIYQGGIKSAVYRRHESGMWTSLTWLKNKKARVETSKKLYKYYEKVEKKEASNHHKKRCYNFKEDLCLAYFGSGKHRESFREFISVVFKYTSNLKLKKTGRFTKKYAVFVFGGVEKAIRRSILS